MPLTSGAPLKLKDTADFQRMQDSSNGDLNYLAFRAGEEIASTATSTTRGMLQTTTASRYVGLYVDTFLDSAVGTYPAQATSQIALTTLYQNFGSDSSGSLGPDIARRPVLIADSDFGTITVGRPSSIPAGAAGYVTISDVIGDSLTIKIPSSRNNVFDTFCSSSINIADSAVNGTAIAGGNIRLGSSLHEPPKLLAPIVRGVTTGRYEDSDNAYVFNVENVTIGGTAYSSSSANIEYQAGDYYIYVDNVDQDIYQLKIKEYNDSDMSVLRDRLTSILHTNEYPGSFRLASTNPNSNNYDVWESNAFVDTRTSGNINYSLFLKTSDSAGARPDQVLPFAIKRANGDSGTYQGLQLMDSDQVGENFALEVLNVMGGTNDGDYDANIGQYLLLSNTSGEPNGLGYSGTWAARGVASNTKHTVSTANYTRSRESNFSSAYATDYTGTFTRNRVSTFTRTRSSSFTADSTTTDVESRTSTFVLGFLGNYLNEFTRNVDTSSESPFTRQTNYGSDTFTTEYVGPNFQSVYVKETSYTGTYSGDQAVNFVSTADGGGLYGYAGGDYVSGAGNFVNKQNLEDYIDNFAGLANPYTDTYVNARTQYIEAPYIFEDYIYDTLSTNQIDATDQTGELRGIDLTMFGQSGGPSGSGTSYSGPTGYANNYMTVDQYSGVTINYVGNYSGQFYVNYTQGYVGNDIITTDTFVSVTYPYGAYGPSVTNFYVGAGTGAYLGPEEDGLTAVMVKPADNGDGNYHNVTAFRHNRIIFSARNVQAGSSFRGSDGKVYKAGEFIASYPSMIHWVRYIIGIISYTQLQGVWYELKEVNVADQSESFTGNVNYVGDYVHNAQIGYTTEYQGTDTFIGNFTGFIVESYQADYQRTTEDQYVTAYEGNYTGDFVNEFLADFQNVYTTNYVGDFGGAYTGTSTYTGDFTSNFQGDFLETSYAYYPYNFIAGAEYTGSNTQISSISDENNMIIINYSPYNPGGTGGTWYMRIIVGGSEVYSGPTGGSSLNDDHFAYPVSVGGYLYQRYPNNNQSWQSGTGYFYFQWARWPSSNAGEGLFGSYTGGYQTNYQRTDTAEIGYTGAFLSDKNVDYATDYLNYSAPYVTNYERVSTRTTEVSYAGGSDAYVNYSAPYIGEYIGNFVGDFSLEFTGDYANYVTPYTGNFEGAFANEYLTDYQQEYTGDFEGKTIDASTEGVETYTLYVRTE